MNSHRLAHGECSAVLPNRARSDARARGDIDVRTLPDLNKPTSDHAHNTAPMLASQRCGAKIRCGGWCRAPAVRGKRRCRMHGGVPKSGAPAANRNARKHGLFTKDAVAERKRVRDLLGEARKLLEGIK